MKTLLSLYLLLACAANADGWDPNLALDQEITFVSLGSNCEIASHLNENHLRNAAFPFDWLLTCNHRQFLSLLEHDFACFLDERYLIQHPTHPYVLEHVLYEIEFRHDWPFSDLEYDASRLKEQLREMHTKYERRINRFRQLRNYPGKVFFIRMVYDVANDPDLYWGIQNTEQIATQEAQELKDVLDRYFPELNFTLVIINYLENKTPPLQKIDGVVEFKIRKTHKHIDYTNAFKTLL